MDVISYSDTRTNLKRVIDRVVADRAPILVTRQNGESVVMVSLADWSSIEETLHLGSTRANEVRLMAAITELDAEGGTVRDLIVS
jgi:antitoxin YefM